MTQTTKIAVNALLALAVALGLVWFLSRHSATTPNTNTSSSETSLATTSTQNTGHSASASVGVQGAASSDSGLATSLPEPSLNRPYTPPSNSPADVQAADKTAVADAIAQLKIDPNHLAYWLQLAVYEKNAGDYAGAEEIWIYCIARWPTSSVAYNDLADLYGNYLHEYDKAVTYWNKLITLQPSDISAYLNLATLYAANMHNVSEAQATIAQGLKANPNDADLLNAQKQYQ